jgi:hypothetical protein
LGFPDDTCPAPTTPLKTDSGDLYVFQPYQRFDGDSTASVYDIEHSQLGIGSVVAGRGYPLSLTANQDTQSLTASSTLEAVSEILNNAVGADHSYSPATSSLATDFTNPTVLSGAASSCASFDPTTSICADLTPIPLHTNRGDFLLFEPYTADDAATDNSSRPHSINWGSFWIEPVTGGKREKT